MEAAYAAIIAVMGTLLGSITTHLLQRRMAAEQATSLRDERLRQEQLAACSAFAGTLTELKRALITLWYCRRGSGRPEEKRAAWVEADRLGAAAEAARFRMLILLDEPSLVALADVAFASLDDIKEVPERGDLVAVEERFAQAVQTYIAAASRVLR